MTHSMTAFARQQSTQDWGTLTWEIRSVNQRFLEPHFRLPETLRELEIPLREQLRKRLHRGKVECTLRFQSGDATSADFSLNMTLVEQLAEKITDVNYYLPNPAPVNALELMQWPGVMQTAETDLQAILAEARRLFDQTLDDLIASRQREGKELASLVEQRLDGMVKVVSQVRDRLPEILQRQRENILTRLEEAKVELDPNRLEQEMVMIAQKADVDEELDRLDTHIAEVRRVLKQKGAIGRRLDFLMQELNREANTLSSKSIVTETTQCAVELKVLIEQMREQIQNIE